VPEKGKDHYKKRKPRHHKAVQSGQDPSSKPLTSDDEALVSALRIRPHRAPADVQSHHRYSVDGILDGSRRDNLMDWRHSTLDLLTMPAEIVILKRKAKHQDAHRSLSTHGPTSLKALKERSCSVKSAGRLSLANNAAA
jgi:hypothetical protein